MSTKKIFQRSCFPLDFSSTFPKFAAEKPRRERASGRAPTSREAGTHASRGWLEGKRDSQGIGGAGHGAVRTKQNVFVSFFVSLRGDSSQTHHPTQKCLSDMEAVGGGAKEEDVTEEVVVGTAAQLGRHGSKVSETGRLALRRNRTHHPPALMFDSQWLWVC